MGQVIWFHYCFNKQWWKFCNVVKLIGSVSTNKCKHGYWQIFPYIGQEPPILPTSITMTMGPKKYVFAPCYSLFDWINEGLDNAHLMPFLDEHLHIHVSLNSWCHNCGSFNWLCARIKIRFKCPIHIHIHKNICMTHLYPSIGVHFFVFLDLLELCHNVF